jgi:colicin import membrane protein
MTARSIERYMALSALIHFAFLSIFFITARKANIFTMPSPYTIRLVSPDFLKKKTLDMDESTNARTLEAAPSQAKQKAEPSRDESYVSERLQALRAKEKLRRIVRLREMLSLRHRQEESSVNKGAESKAPRAAEGQADAVLSEYFSDVKDRIWQQWVFPAASEQKLEAVISISILRDGTIKVNGIERSSGNSLFDRSVIKAVNRASPVESPPYEMEIGVRFFL